MEPSTILYWSDLSRTLWIIHFRVPPSNMGPVNRVSVARDRWQLGNLYHGGLGHEVGLIDMSYPAPMKKHSPPVESSLRIESFRVSVDCFR